MPPPSLGLRLGDALIARGGSTNMTCVTPSYFPPVMPIATNPTSTFKGRRQFKIWSKGDAFAVVDLNTEVTLSTTVVNAHVKSSSEETCMTCFPRPNRNNSSLRSSYGLVGFGVPPEYVVTSVDLVTTDALCSAYRTPTMIGTFAISSSARAGATHVTVDVDTDRALTRVVPTRQPMFAQSPSESLTPTLIVSPPVRPYVPLLTVAAPGVSQ
mmetsp:Transcript_7872/g.31582  ORF Transcript_7872/g.31582 Transcript_7872/m.31582 type:complete len:212 (-) Transcript_7872:699-1334(-)